MIQRKVPVLTADHFAASNSPLAEDFRLRSSALPAAQPLFL